MLNPKMEMELNKQINEELYSAYLYQSMAAYFAANNLNGFAKWMDVQAAEEVNHARKFYHFIIDRMGRVVLEAIEKPPLEWDSPLAAMEAALKHEQHVTGRIHFLVDLAREVKDKATEVMLNWFVMEQVEEEASVDEYVQMLKMFGGKPQGLMMINREMGKREDD
ncbi:MAG TPA: ferritin [Thermotogota bacterium]|nr:MAG: Ferritin [Thermotogota bacterium ADurb.Bin062]HNW47625.1 ferritin [Thermotogota bacterium]HNY82272.1 ferritin [Thermotogota bacterium]HOF24481.1 ferritin [Thermotogota bacterium]HOH12657.1 ferritin [Thermotogota bacterium]